MLLFICFIIIFQKMFLREIIYFLLNVWYSCNFFYIPMLPLTLSFIYRHDYNFGSGKKRLFCQRFFLFLGECVQSKNKQMFCQIFPQINFLIKPFLISTNNPQEVLNKWNVHHITEERAKNTKKDQILSLHKSLASFFTKRPI